MKTIAGALACVFMLPLAVMSADDSGQRTAASRKAAQAFMEQLKSELQAGMKSGGPVAAIEVCHTRAPRIAAQASKDNGWEIGRTSLKVRNPANAPDDWERKVLESFETRKAKGEPVVDLEYAEVVADNGQRKFRYMKAIPTGLVCVQCHGGNIDAAVEAKIDALYPNDQARGFEAGDIRGAFTITQPM